MKQGNSGFLPLCATALLGLAVTGLPQTAGAQSLGAPITHTLGNASDAALDKLAQPGAFYADEAVRILLPGPLKKASGLMKLTDQAGLTSDLTKSLNDAAGLAAKEAKPIFRSAIDKMTLQDGISVASKKDGATRYLQQSAGGDLRTKVRPLIVSALTEVGAYNQVEKLGGSGGGLLSSAGLSRDGLTDSVTDQTLSGIFKYMGAEEANLRANPLAAGKKLLKGLN